jgi:hypothetical protein
MEKKHKEAIHLKRQKERETDFLREINHMYQEFLCHLRESFVSLKNATTSFQYTGDLWNVVQLTYMSSGSEMLRGRPEYFSVLSSHTSRRAASC